MDLCELPTLPLTRQVLASQFNGRSHQDSVAYPVLRTLQGQESWFPRPKLCLYRVPSASRSPEVTSCACVARLSLVIACGIGVQIYFNLPSMMVNFQAATSTSTDFLIRLPAALWDKSLTLGGIQNPLHIHEVGDIGGLLRYFSLPSRHLPMGRCEASAVQAKYPDPQQSGGHRRSQKKPPHLIPGPERCYRPHSKDWAP
jgi:hypothetical protein